MKERGKELKSYLGGPYLGKDRGGDLLTWERREAITVRIYLGEERSGDVTRTTADVKYSLLFLLIGHGSSLVIKKPLRFIHIVVRSVLMDSN
jgi:hypothetical protein